MQPPAPRVDTERQADREPQVKHAAAVWNFVRTDRVGRGLGIAWAIVAWFALTWLSVVVTCLLLLVTAAVVAAERRRRDPVLEDDLDDLI
jgi:hypothetical protein